MPGRYGRDAKFGLVLGSCAVTGIAWIDLFFDGPLMAMQWLLIGIAWNLLYAELQGDW